MASKKTLINRLNHLCNDGMSNREHWGFGYYKLSAKGKWDAAMNANDQYDRTDPECQWCILDETDFNSLPIAYVGGCWNIATPGGGTYYVSEKYIRPLTKMGLKALLRKNKRR